MRRGYQVYKQVCSACHSMKYLPYYDLIEATHTRDEAKAEAADATVSLFCLEMYHLIKLLLASISIY